MIITGFYVSDEAVELLRNVKEKIGVIAVAGKYRTGKSFLLNRIILNKTDNNGFGVGPTINPCTKVRIFYIYSVRDCGFGISLLRWKAEMGSRHIKSSLLTVRV